ncbi:MAG TPA: NYN domain-containing protein [Candidatus Paceibacterota bacterium]|nr:NYN domain-containing protein [Candidatus Paceibacterota bacterium]HRU35749.1 NYN domain-containing protein [Candidatus Paceibacterota bacterium]
MDIPQGILNKFIVRKDYLDWINKETAIFAYLDLTNMFHWQDVLGWKFRIEDVVGQLFTFPNIKEIKIYYGKNERDLKNSEAFHDRIKKTGAILRTKSMKFITKEINEGLFFQRRTITLFDGSVRNKIQELIDELQKSGIIIEEPKCNFDVEMTMDMLDDTEKLTAVMLFSGDSDLKEPLERLKVKNKKIGIVGVRGIVAGELHDIKDKYIDFGKFYTGERVYIKSENPAFGGTA